MNCSAGGAAHPHAPDTKIQTNMFSIWLLLNKVVCSYTVNTIIKSVHVSFLVQNRLVHVVNRRPIPPPGEKKRRRRSEVAVQRHLRSGGAEVVLDLLTRLKHDLLFEQKIDIQILNIDIESEDKVSRYIAISIFLPTPSIIQKGYHLRSQV